jgi:hypothetical protein
VIVQNREKYNFAVCGNYKTQEYGINHSLSKIREYEFLLSSWDAIDGNRGDIRDFKFPLLAELYSPRTACGCLSLYLTHSLTHCRVLWYLEHEHPLTILKPERRSDMRHLRKFPPTWIIRALVYKFQIHLRLWGMRLPESVYSVRVEVACSVVITSNWTLSQMSNRITTMSSRNMLQSLRRLLLFLLIRKQHLLP